SRGIFTRFNPCTNPAWDTAQRFTKAQNSDLIGRTIREAAAGQDSLSFLLDLLSEDPCACVISLSRRPEHTPDRDAFVDCGDACIGLDTWCFDYAAALSEGDMPLECGSPATYCGMTKFLEDQRPQRPIEEIVRRLTGNAAERLHLRDRGCIREGYRADVLLLDPARFSSNENLSDPRCGASGLDYVIVNGEIAVRDGAHTHVRSGEIL
ncbi:MAG: amidohydrolase family protein, partial [Clostridia bacterium]|nr:amidohydrolase family protein [Clostridia bacterium]